MSEDADVEAPEPDVFPVGLWAQFRDKLGRYLLGALLLCIQQGLMAKRDFLVRDGVDALSSVVPSAAVEAAVWMVIVSVSAATVRVLSRVAMFTAGRSVEYELRAVLLARLHQLGPSFFRHMPTGEVMSRATNDLAQVRLLLGFGILNIVSSAFALVSALYVMSSVSVPLTLASLVMLPLLLLITRSYSTRMFARVRENQAVIGKMSDRVLASLAGVRVVRSFGLEAAETRAFDVVNADYLDKSLALARLRGSIGPVMGALSSVGVLVVFWYGGRLIANGDMTRGDFVSFWLALLRLTWPLMAIGFVAGIVQRGRAGYSRLADIYDAEPDLKSGPLPAPAVVRGALEVRGLSFSYGETPVLSDVSFEVRAGASLAIVGRTGSGKSTLAALLARIHPTPSKSVFLDGIDVCDLPLGTVRASIGYAQQDAFLFSTTVARNIGFSLDDTESQDAHRIIRESAAEASVLDELDDLPDGFDTVVGERGVQLSGGQRQRVALGRALLRRSPVLVLDDPMSAVDSRTETVILEANERQKKERTVVLITHRVSAAKRCDEVIVLDGGRVVARGKHDELLAAGGIYATFAEEQALEADLEELSPQPVAPISLSPA